MGALEKKSSSSRLVCAAGAAEGFVFCSVWMVIFPSNDAVAVRPGLPGLKRVRKVQLVASGNSP